MRKFEKKISEKSSTIDNFFDGFFTRVSEFPTFSSYWDESFRVTTKNTLSEYYNVKMHKEGEEDELL